MTESSLSGATVRTSASFATLLDARYRIIERIGDGQIAKVYSAHDLAQHRKVALKILREEVAQVLDDRFLQEIEITTSLDHENIVAVYASGTVNGIPYFVMPFIEGESLEVKLDREGALEIEQAIEFAAVIGGALSYAHSMGVVHRDVKPGNILLDDNRLTVTDFGIALPLNERRRITLGGITLGTPEYMSPEQATNPSAVDHRSDIYSLGCTLYTMLTGRPPYEAPGFRAMIIKHTLEAVPSARKLRGEVSRRLDKVVALSMAKAPEDRFADVDDFIHALRTA